MPHSIIYCMCDQECLSFEIYSSYYKSDFSTLSSPAKGSTVLSFPSSTPSVKTHIPTNFDFRGALKILFVGIKKANRNRVKGVLTPLAPNLVEHIYGCEAAGQDFVPQTHKKCSTLELLVIIYF